jgi:hypothetical protein
MLPASSPATKEHSMEQHVKIVAILNIVCGGLGIVIALLALLFFGGMAGIVHSDPAPDSEVGVAALGIIGVIAFLTIALFSVPALIGGIGLLKFREWARILVIVVSALNLLNIPFGTALGIYGLWVLTQDGTRTLLKGKEGVWSSGGIRQPGS